MNSTAKSPSQLADEVRSTAQDAVESTRAYAQNAVDAAGQKVRNLRHDVEPAVEQIASRVQQAVQRGLEAASKSGVRAQERFTDAAQVTTRYISDQPVRAVLFAAAAGAAITALLVLATRRRDDY
jgi:ElaB/YqjD/DUF883 family membrane-anchored ribosome-binding protein